MRPEHLVRLAERLCDRSPEVRVVGIHADRWPGGGSIAVNGDTFPVRWCGSRLAVSQQLSALAEGDRLIVVTPLTDADLGLDVLARLARRRLLYPEPWQMVRDAYEVSSVDPRLPMQTWMADALLGARPQGRRATPTNVLDADSAWTHLLGHYLGLPSGRPDVETIIRWSMEPDTTGRFEALPAPFAEAVRTRLAESAGGLGGLLAEGIAAGHPRELLPIGLVCDLLFDGESEPNPPDPVLAQAAARLEPFLGGASVEPARGRDWGVAARAVLGALRGDRRGEWLDRAESLLASLKAEAFSERSSVLPSGFASRLARFAEAGAAAIAVASTEALESAEAAFRRVREHAACDEQVDRARRLEMAMRLVRSLRRRAEATKDLPGMMAQHARGDAFEDWARRSLLGGDEHPEIGKLFGALYRAVRARREERNRRFAGAVRDWLTGKAKGDVVPIEQCLARTVVPLAEERPVLVLVLDGMDASIFHELGESLWKHGWRRQRRTEPDAVLAVLPTVTESSRMALLSGAVMPGTAAAEKSAFAQHPDLLKVSRSGRPPLLFHKADLTGGAAEGLAAPAREALGDEQRRVVGIVLNAVDDHLAKSEQMQITWRIESIKLLPAILMEARKVGRAFVLTSDHGHVLEADGVKLPGDGEGRWRSAASPASESEIEIGGARVRAATGQERIVLPWSEAVRYGSKRNGYHGGVSVQEAVVPVGVYAGPGEMLEGWEPAPLSYPRWWTAEESREAPLRLPEPGPATAPESPTGPQPDLFAEADRPQPAAATRWAPLFASEVYAAQRQLAGRSAPDDGTVGAALEALCDSRAERLPLVTLAKRLDVAPQSHVRRTVTGLQRLLNVDGYPVLRLDDDGEHVELDGALLVERFELEP